MLRIIQNRSAASAKSYYSKADYYSEGQELTGRWGGKGAAMLGLRGDVDRRDFDSLCDNLHPASKRKLTPRNDNDRTVGYDFNFHVPKGVSLAYLLHQDDRILTAFRESVRETMDELEVDMKTRVRTDGRDSDRLTGNLVYSEFVHTTARPVNGVPDPHLHAHCFVFNATFDQQERRWKAGNFRDIKRDAPYFEAAFYARLGKRLENMGYPLRRQGKQWDLATIPKSLSTKFSRRTEQIEKLAADRGITGADSKSQLGATSREKKDSELSLRQLRDIWRQRCSADDEAAIALLGSGKAGRPQEGYVAEDAAIAHAVDHSFERSSVVPKRMLLAEALRYGVGKVDIERTKVRLEKGVLIRTLEGRDYATTKEVLAEEKIMLEFARAGRNAVRPLNKSWKIRREWLNRGQQGAVAHILHSRDRVTVLKGGAGTGKTSLMQEAVEAIREGGREVFTFAPSAEASRGVLKQEGFENATTVAALLADERMQKETAGQVIWIDEAGLLGTRALGRVFDIAKQFDCRVVLSGDWAQHSSVERGSAMRLLEREGGIKPAVVTAIQRQRGKYREAVAMLASGRVEEGFDRLDDLGWIKELGDGERENAAAREYADALNTGESVLVVSPTHREAEVTCAAIRNELKSRGMLGKEERSVLRLLPLNLTEAERRDEAMYEAGDVIVFQQNAKGHRKGERIVVQGELSPQLAALAKRFQVYRSSALMLAAGDRIRVTANGLTKDGHRLNNGGVYDVAGFTEGGDVRLGNGWVIDAAHGFVSQGRVLTSHASQGKTVDRVILVESSQSLPAASREQFYVSVSRGRNQSTIYSDDKQALRCAVGHSSPRLSAVELIKPCYGNRHRLATYFSQQVQQASARTAATIRELVHER